jgi:hypothetical protein
MELRPENLGVMQKCVAKVEEVTKLLAEHGVRVHQVTDISIFAGCNDFGSATLVLDLDFRQPADSTEA